MFKSITGWCYADYIARGKVAVRWILVMPLALLFSGLSVASVGFTFFMLAWSESFRSLPGADGVLPGSICSFVAAYIFLLSGVKLAPKAKRNVTYALVGLSTVIILIAIYVAMSFERNNIALGVSFSLLGIDVAFMRIARKNYYAEVPAPATSGI